MLASVDADRAEDVKRAVSDTLVKVLFNYAEEQIERAKKEGSSADLLRFTREKAALTRDLPRKLQNEEF